LLSTVLRLFWQGFSWYSIAGILEQIERKVKT